MASWACSKCRTVYAVGIPACPQCGSTDYTDEGGIVAKASAEGGATSYVAEGDAVPADVPEGVRLVGPGAPAEAGDIPAEGTGQAPQGTPEPEAAPDEPGQRETEPDGDEDGPPDYMAYRVTDLRDLCRDRGLPVTGAKPDLAAALAEWDAEHPDGDGGSM